MPPSPSAEVRVWIALARSGSRTAVDRLCRHFEPEVLGYTRRHMGPVVRRWVEPADIVQGVLFEVLHGLPELDPEVSLEPEELTARLLRTTRSRLRDAYRKHMARAGESILPENEQRRRPRRGPDGDETSGEVTRGDTRRWLAALVQRLPEHYAEPVRLVGLEGKTYAEAARELGLNDETVRKRYERARARLRERLEKTRRV